MLRNNYIRRIQLAIANNLDLGNSRNFFSHQLKDGTAEVPGDTHVRMGVPEPVTKKGMVKALAT